VVTVSSLASNGVMFSALPTGWMDQDVGLGSIGGKRILCKRSVYGKRLRVCPGWGYADTMHYAYRPLSGDGAIVARLRSTNGGYPVVGVMVPDTLDTAAARWFWVVLRLWQYDLCGHAFDRRCHHRTRGPLCAVPRLD